MARLQEIIFAGQKIVTEFYQRTIYSTWVLATGATGFRPFSNAEPDTLRNYNKGQNIFDSNQGRLLAMRADIFGASYATPLFQDSNSAYDFGILDAWNQVLSQATIQIVQDSRIVHQDLLKSMVLHLPYPLLSSAGAPLGAVVHGDGSANVRDASKRGVYWRPPIDVSNGRTLEFSVALPSTVSIPAELNNSIIQFELVVEEIPQSNAQQVRN